MVASLTTPDNFKPGYTWGVSRVVLGLKGLVQPQRGLNCTYALVCCPLAMTLHLHMVTALTALTW
jgi:hypothetical protein